VNERFRSGARYQLAFSWLPTRQRSRPRKVRGRDSYIVLNFLNGSPVQRFFSRASVFPLRPISTRSQCFHPLRVGRPNSAISNGQAGCRCWPRLSATVRVWLCPPIRRHGKCTRCANRVLLAIGVDLIAWPEAEIGLYWYRGSIALRWTNIRCGRDGKSHQWPAAAAALTSRDTSQGEIA
jgi:hypothetical protein